MDTDGVGNHPNAWTKASLQYHMPAGEKQAIKAEASAAAAAEVSPSSGLSAPPASDDAAAAAPMELST